MLNIYYSVNHLPFYRLKDTFYNLSLASGQAFMGITLTSLGVWFNPLACPKERLRQVTFNLYFGMTESSNNFHAVILIILFV